MMINNDTFNNGWLNDGIADLRHIVYMIADLRHIGVVAHDDVIRRVSGDAKQLPAIPPAPAGQRNQRLPARHQLEAKEIKDKKA